MDEELKSWLKFLAVVIALVGATALGGCHLQTRHERYMADKGFKCDSTSVK